MRKVIAVIIFVTLILILVTATIVITSKADKNKNKELRENFFITLKKNVNQSDNLNLTHQEGEIICENIQQLKLNETFMKSIGCDTEENCKTNHGVYYIKEFKCIYPFTTNKTSVPNNLPFDRQTCLAMKGMWIEGVC